MSHAKNVGVDLDSVLAHLSLLSSKIWNEWHPEKQFSLDQWTEWNFYDVLGISKTDFHNLLDAAWSRYQEMPFQEPMVLSSLLKLRKEGHKVTIISNRNRYTHHFVTQWLFQNGVFYDSLVLNDSGPSKFSYPIGYLIDDNPHEVERVPEIGDQILLLRDQPWNRDIKGNVPSIKDGYNETNCITPAFRVFSLAEAVEYIVEMNR